MPGEKFVRLSFYVPRFLYEWIGHEAARDGVTISTYIRQTFTRKREDTKEEKAA